jgi:CRP-like cAMP-binding protein
MLDNKPAANLILSGLSATDLRLLQPHLKDVDLPLRMRLERPQQRINAIYFPESGFASVVADGGQRPIEVGLIGREGMTGLSLVLGTDRQSCEIYMQAPGKGKVVRARDLRAAIDQSVTLHRSLLRYAHAFLEQTVRTAVANGRGKIEERLARWLLMADDRIKGGELPLTHEFLAMMLAVRRPGVTAAVQGLERKGMIVRRRGRIVIADRRALEKLARSIYLATDYA